MGGRGSQVIDIGVFEVAWAVAAARRSNMAIKTLYCGGHFEQFPWAKLLVSILNLKRASTNA